VIRRSCKREGCIAAFEVRYPSNPKEFCSRKCAALAGASGPQTMSISEMGRLGVAARMTRSQAHVLEFIAGLTSLEKFQTGVRMGYERAKREFEEEPLGEIGRLTDDALRV
jgi:hypothetical protein